MEVWHSREAHFIQIRRTSKAVFYRLVKCKKNVNVLKK